MMFYLPYILLIMGFSVGCIIFFKNKASTFNNRLLSSLIPPTLSIIILIPLIAVFYAPLWSYTACKFTQVIAFLYDYKVYYGPYSGPIQETIYPPGFIVSFIPSVIFSTPTKFLAACGILNVLYILLPIVIIFSYLHKKNVCSRSMTILFILSTFAIFHITPTLATILMNPHADAPAICFGILACFAVFEIKPKENLSIKRMLLSSLFFSMSFWTKQVEFFLILALLIYVLLLYGWHQMLRYLTFMFSASAIVSLFFFITFGVDNMLFNIIIIPYSHPLRWGLSEGIKNFSSAFLYRTMFFLLPASFLFVIKNRANFKIKNLLKNNTYLIFLLAWFFLLPSGYLSYSKVGGYANSYHSLAYLVIAFMILNLYLMEFSIHNWKKFFYVLCILLVFPCCMVFMDTKNIYLVYEKFKFNPQEEAYEYIKKNPNSDEIYFPWKTLAVLMASKKLYHFEYAVKDRELAGFKPSMIHINQHVPKNMKYIASKFEGYLRFEKRSRDYFYELTKQLKINNMVSFFPEFKTTTSIKELPGWTIISKEGF